jgi:spermidine synthase
MTLLFAAAMFVNALLLFLVQPMFAKLLLPRFGGSPAVWTTCMLFFQSALLAGYAYSHSVVRVRKSWQQAAVHISVMALPILTLPIAVSSTMSTAGNPIASVLWLSTVAVGAPFFALATSAPLLQRWFAASHRHTAIDPYFLYAASNIGSFASLVLYPTVIEPALELSTQTRVWSVGYSIAVSLTLICAIVMWRRTPGASSEPASSFGADSEVVTWSRRARWIALAFVPSSLMLAVTAYISTDVAAVPLLWVVPLAIYLITFVVTFSSYSPRAVSVCNRFFPLVLLFLTFLLTSEARLPLAPMTAVHLVAFFYLAVLCHGHLSADRPSTRHLTDFYLSLAIGGALGGVFNSLLAPLIFTSVLEYPIALACGIFLLTFKPDTPALRSRPRWWVEPVLVAALTITALKWPGTGITIAVITWVLLLGAVLVCFSVSQQRRRLGVCVLLMLGLYVVLGGRGSIDVAYASRTFFGSYRVASDPDHRSFTLFHGTTIHGRQNIGSPEPLTYYHRGSPIAQVFMARAGTIKSVGAVGLGTGTLAAYAEPGQQWTFYEIDPEVERIARDPRYFTHLDRCGASCRVVIGDARLSLQQRTDTHDIIVLDAFSSDSIPIHLLTREAVQIYLSRLNPAGVLAIHISNNHLDLLPVVAGMMRDLRLAGRFQLQSSSDITSGKYGSQWAVLARSEATLGVIATDDRWKQLRRSEERTWTDDFSNIWSVIKWR